MGYYSYHSIKIYPNSQTRIRQISNAINVEAGNEALTPSGNSNKSCKWYSWECDMISVSIRFPDTIISLYVKGEESGDCARYDFYYGTMVKSWEFEGIPDLTQAEINSILNS